MEPMRCYGNVNTNDRYQFVFNKEFKRLKSSTVEVDENFNPLFTKKLGYVPGDYFTVFGPSACHNGKLYANDAHGMVGAIRRLTAKRLPEAEGEHELLRENQFRNMRKDTWGNLAMYISNLQQKIRNILSSVTVDECVLRNMWADQPHEKRTLRQRTRLEMYSDPPVRPTGMYKKYVGYKVKTYEVLEDGKYVRGIADLTPPASTRLGYYIDYVKEAFSQPYITRDLYAEFVKAPELDKLTDVFEKLINPPSNIYFAYFSDDASLSVRCSDGIFYSDSDISKSDGSQYQPVFDVLQEIMDIDSRFTKDIIATFLQLSQPLCAYNPENMKEKLIFISILGSRLFSGSTLTTMVNNIANLLIALRFSEMYRISLTIAEVQALYTACAREIGYIVRLKPTTVVQKLSFLKHFPAYNIKGQLEPVLLPGVPLRAFGKCKGDVPGSGKTPLHQRFRQFNSELAISMKNAGESSILAAFRTHILESHGTYKQGFLGEKLASETHANATSGISAFGTIKRDWISNDQFMARYDLLEYQIDELCWYISNTPVGQAYRCDASDAMLSMDYSYGQ